MASNFVDLNQAAELLGVTPETLVEMRSQGEIFGFRDGSSWKFKMDELERVAQERGISLGGKEPESDFSLGAESDLDLSKPLFGDDDESLAPDVSDGSSLGELLKSDDMVVDLGLGGGGEADEADEADSLLVTDDAPMLADSGRGSVLGQSGSPDSDLQLSFDDDDDDVLSDEPSLTGGGGGSSILGDMDLTSGDQGGSDVRLAPSDDGSDVSLVPDSDELLVGPDASGIGSGDTPEVSAASSEFSGLELAEGDDDEISLSKDTGTGDLELNTDSGGTGDLELSLDSGTGDLELSLDSGTGDLELDLESGSLDLDDSLEDDDDDLVLGDSSPLGSDVTLGAGDTGINLTSASDSGLSLEEDPIDIAGQPISSLELPDENVVALEGDSDPDEATQLKRDEAFLLSPDGVGMEEEESASQVIALDNSEQFDQNAATMLGQDAFGGGLEAQLQPMGEADASVGGVLGGGGDSLAPLDHAAMAPQQNAAGFGAPATAGVGAAPMVEAPKEAPYTIFNVLALLIITGVLTISGMLMMDVVRNMWSWNAGGPPPSTSLMEGLLSALGIQ